MANTRTTHDVAATVSIVTFPEAGQPHTIKNTGAQTVYYQLNSDGTDLAGNASALADLANGSVAAGESVGFAQNVGRLAAVCATGLTSTLAVRAGQFIPAPSSVDGTGLALEAGNLATVAGDLGATTDEPVGDNTTAEGATARTGVSLWKRIANVLIAMLAKLPAVGTAGTASANVLTVQGIANGTAVAADIAALTSAPTEKAPTVLTQVLGATPATAVALAANGTFARKVVLMAKKAAGSNAAEIYLGTSTVSPTDQQTVLDAGDYWEFEAPVGTKFDLNDLYISGLTTADGVTGIYIPA